MNVISSILWFITTIFVMFVSLYLSLYLKFPQLRVSNIVKLYKYNDNKETLKLLNFSLASKIGVGSISGIAIALVIGGKGTIFWIWISSIFLGVITYCETKLGIKFGSPQIYIRDQLKNSKLSNIYSAFIVFIYLIAFILIQTNTIIMSIESIFYIDKVFIIAPLILLVVYSIKYGIERITNVVSVLVPIMGTLYIIIGIIIIFRNVDNILIIFNEIKNDIFSVKSLSSIPIIVGFERSIFCNEAGMGTTAMVSSLSTKKNCNNQITLNVLGTYFITLIVCTITAFIILTTSYESLNITDINGIEIVAYAFYYHFKMFGLYLLVIIVFLFAFSTIITSYYYGKINNKKENISKFIVIIIMLVGAFFNPTYIWLFADILASIITIINLYAIFKLRKKIRSNL